MVWVSHDFRVAHLNLLRPFVISAYITLYPSSLLEQLFVPETLNIYSAFALGEYSPKLLNWTEPKRLDSTSRQHVPKVLYRHLPLQCRDLPDRPPRLHNSQGPYSPCILQALTNHILTPNPAHRLFSAIASIANATLALASPPTLPYRRQACTGPRASRNFTSTRANAALVFLGCSAGTAGRLSRPSRVVRMKLLLSKRGH